MGKVLVVIDAQEDNVYGSLKTPEAQEAVKIIQQVVDYAAEHFKKPVYYTKDTHGPNYPGMLEGRTFPVVHCQENTHGWKICREALTDSCQIVKKRTFGHIGWVNDRFGTDTDEIWLCGFQTERAVIANFHILRALYPDAKIRVIQDACAGMTPENHNAALNVMSCCCADICWWDDLLAVQETNF